MTTEDLRLKPDVAVRGTVLWRDLPEGAGIIIHDGDTAIFIALEDAEHLNFFKPELGMVVHVRGFAELRGSGPVIVPDAIEIEGTSAFPEPLKLDLPAAKSAANVAQWGALEGVVQRAAIQKGKQGSFVHLTLGTTSGQFEATMMPPPDLTPPDLENARVEVRGVVLPILNFRREAVGITVRSERSEDLKILSPGGGDPFDSPFKPLNRIRLFKTPETKLHRIRVQGMVTYSEPGQLIFLEGDGVGLRVGTYSELELSPGDVVEAAGFVSWTLPTAELRNAKLRILKPGKPPLPIDVNPEQIIQSTGRAPQDLGERDVQDFEGRLVRIEGAVTGVYLDNEGAEGARLSIKVKDSKPVTALITGSELGDLAKLAPGTTVRATGIARIRYAVEGGIRHKLEPWSMALLLRSASDVQMISAPPAWWMSIRRTQLAGGVAVLLILAGVLVWLGRRDGLREAKYREQALRAYRNWELESEACRRERVRLANDLHDGFQQLLAGADYRAQAATASLVGEEEDARKHLNQVHQILGHTKIAFRNTLKGMVGEESRTTNLTEGLSHVASRMEQWSERVIINSSGESRPLTPLMFGALLLLFQEAVGNAIKHGNASRIDVNIEYGPDLLSLQIQDNGPGFDLIAARSKRDAQFGLNSMQDRVQWMGGKLEILSAPGQGTRISVSVPYMSDIIELPSSEEIRSNDNSIKEPIWQTPKK
jgi:signal transduction histidine kinase